MIPKIIHYCWFGGNDMPAEYHSYIADWQALHPGWKVIRWDETNAPVTEPYLANALRLGNWSNCSNYIRLWALRHQGGVYMDTDFKLLKPLDSFLSEQCFLGFEQEPSGDAGFIINNAIMGALPGHAFIEACFQELTTTFDASEQSDLSGPGLTTKMLQSQWGLKEYGLIRLPDVTIYPTEYFYPIHVHNAYLLNNYREHISPKTCGIHMWGRSWIGKKELMEIVDYLNFRIGNQEKYIAQLEASTEEANKKSEEIFYWKTFFEEEYNRVKKLADTAGAAAAKLDRQTLELISQKLDDQAQRLDGHQERSASLQNLATQQSKALQTLRQELEERLAILKRLEVLDRLGKLEELDGLSAQLRQSAEAGKERGERLSALEEALRQLAENGTRVQSALQQQSAATETFRQDLLQYRETLAAFGESANEQANQLRQELQRQWQEQQHQWKEHQALLAGKLEEYQDSLAERLAAYQTRLTERLDQQQSRLDEQISGQRADAEQKASAASAEIRDLKKNIAQLEETVSGLSDIAQLLLKKELENEQLRQSHDRNRSQMEELAQKNTELARLLEEKEKTEASLKNTIDEMRNTLPYKLLHKAFRKKHN